jgi:hypothetical protein
LAVHMLYRNACNLGTFLCYLNPSLHRPQCALTLVSQVQVPPYCWSEKISQAKAAVRDTVFWFPPNHGCSTWHKMSFFFKPDPEIHRTHLITNKRSLIFGLVTDFASEIQFICLLYDRHYCSLLRLESELTIDVAQYITIVNTLV